MSLRLSVSNHLSKQFCDHCRKLRSDQGLALRIVHRHSSCWTTSRSRLEWSSPGRFDSRPLAPPGGEGPPQLGNASAAPSWTDATRAGGKLTSVVPVRSAVPSAPWTLQTEAPVCVRERAAGGRRVLGTSRAIKGLSSAGGTHSSTGRTPQTSSAARPIQHPTMNGLFALTLVSTLVAACSGGLLNHGGHYGGATSYQNVHIESHGSVPVPVASGHHGGFGGGHGIALADGGHHGLELGAGLLQHDGGLGLAAIGGGHDFGGHLEGGFDGGYGGGLHH
ncbi:keratin, type II cytoskeletal 2 epidermal-like [Schistocerca gregaria]|uniref:keratin, type II cytoskeletal 2 epidermal-like n=1 Tax=Schistocerca gregaria TaxID=7010 RepID=UPI00211DAD3C|nr:keratin, type II cytoskeletal 2 epidermal-like [Schistocerca gregaria]